MVTQSVDHGCQSIPSDTGFFGRPSRRRSDPAARPSATRGPATGKRFRDPRPRGALAWAMKGWNRWHFPRPAASAIGPAQAPLGRDRHQPVPWRPARQHVTHPLLSRDASPASPKCAQTQHGCRPPRLAVNRRPRPSGEAQPPRSRSRLGRCSTAVTVTRPFPRQERRRTQLRASSKQPPASTLPASWKCRRR